MNLSMSTAIPNCIHWARICTFLLLWHWLKLIRLLLSWAKGLEGGNASDTFVAAATATAAGNSNAADAVGALVMLGYSQSEAAIAVGKLDQTLSTEDLIKQALKQLA